MSNNDKVSPIVGRTMVRFFTRQSQLDLEAGKPVHRVVDDYLRAIEPYAEHVDWSKLLRDLGIKVSCTATSRPRT